MINRKIILAISLSIIFSTNIIGCQKLNSISTKETPYYTLNIDGNKKYFDEDNDDIKAICSLISEYLNLLISVDYHNDDYLAFLDLYTDEVRARDKEMGYAEYYKDTFTEIELVRELNDFEITEIELYNSYGTYTADVTFNYICTNINGTDEYLTDYNIKLNKKYITNSKIQLEKQSDGWRLYELLINESMTELE